MSQLGVELELEREMAGCAENDSDSPFEQLTRLPRISVATSRKGFFHPASKSAIKQVLLYFGDLSVYGIREISLVQRHNTAADKLLFGALSIPGKILLYEQPELPWHLSGKLPRQQLDLITEAGATVEFSSDESRCKIEWPSDTLPDFMLFEVLMHEIGHHVIQQFKGKRQGQVLRTKDHEAVATQFARRCRLEYFGEKQ